MKTIILSLLFLSLPYFVIAQKSFSDKLSLSLNLGYVSPEGELSNYNSGNVGFNAAISYNITQSTHAVLSFDRTSFGYRDRDLKPNIPSVYMLGAGLNHSFGKEIVKPFVEVGGGLGVLKKISDFGIPERDYSSLPMVYGKTGGSISLSENFSFTAGIRYNRIFRNPDYNFLTYEGGLKFRLK